MIVLAQFGPAVPEEALVIISAFYIFAMPAAAMVLTVAAAIRLVCR